MVQLFPPSLMITKGGGEFLIYMGTVDGDEYTYPDAPYMLVYASLHGLQRLSGANMWHGDRTFKSCLKPFKQAMLLCFVAVTYWLMTICRIIIA